MNAHISDSEKQLKQRLVELHAERDNARRAVEAARDEMISGQGNASALTQAQSTYSALCEAVAEAERRALKLERQRDDQEKKEKRDNLIAELQRLGDDDRADEAEIKAAIVRAYDALETELEKAASHYCASNNRQPEMARLRAQNGQSVQPFPTHTPERIARLQALFESDPRSQKFAGGVRLMLNHVLDERSKRA
jgi:DNA repair exonuclease SbcCD ATPase subunit